MWGGCGGLVLVPVLLVCPPMNTLNTIAIAPSPRTSTRPPPLHSAAHCPYNKHRDSDPRSARRGLRSHPPTRDKHKAPSPPFRRPLSLQQTRRDESHPVRIDTMLCWE